MRILIQRVRRASVSVRNELVSRIGAGMLILVGIADEDTVEDIEWLVRKCAGLRIFDDAEGVMNLDIRQVGGEVLAVSQFTLMASTKKGNRPSYIRAAGEATALAELLGRPVATGVFGADMQVELINDGPVTIWMDSRNRE
ncbi:MAG: D-tyrosyl-tRNA(Tyr) deacylase [Alistipes sp. 56_11]|nr:MAG: D-tyrosyl-tRNA(Tyr) deacylase [Alistipes sp. 56_11]